MKSEFVKVLFLFLISAPLLAQESNWDWQSEISFRSMVYQNDKKPGTNDSEAALGLKASTTYEKGSLKAVFGGQGRNDYGYLEDLYAVYSFGSEREWRVSSGFQVFNWSATEAFHPADILNSRNYDSDAESLDKKGELNIAIERRLADGWLSLYYFPLFMDPEYPGKESRRGLSVDLEDPVWIVDGAESKKWGEQYGVNFTQTIGDGDLSLHYLARMDRNMPLVGTTKMATVGGTVVPLETPNRPHFFQMNQLGGTYQHIWNDYILKLEGAGRIFKDDDFQVYTARGLRKPVDHSEFALGIEYPHEHENGMESFFYWEANSIFGVDKDARSELSVFQRDMLLAWRLVFNDVMGKEIFASVIYDLERSTEVVVNFNYSQRITDDWKIKMGLRIYEAKQKSTIPTGLESYDDNSSLFAHLTRYF